MKASAFSYAQATVAKKDSAQFLLEFTRRQGAVVAAGRAAIVANAVNDALRPFDAMMIDHRDSVDAAGYPDGVAANLNDDDIKSNIKTTGRTT
jgi:hypothetical protein